MSRTIEAIMLHMAPPSSRVTDQNNRVEKLEKGPTGRDEGVVRLFVYLKRFDCVCDDA